MRIPFLNRPETRAGYTDVIVQALLQEATGSTTASVVQPGSNGGLRGPLGAGASPAQRITPANAGYGGIDASGT